MIEAKKQSTIKTQNMKMFPARAQRDGQLTKKQVF